MGRGRPAKAGRLCAAVLMLAAALPAERLAAERDGGGAGRRGEFEVAAPRARAAPRRAVVPGTLRGVMGYRLPLVGRQAVPDQVVGGVLIPAHTTYVILAPGWWELVDDSEAELEQLRRRAPGAEERR